MSKNPNEVFSSAKNVFVQQTNCLYTEYGQRIAYFQLEDDLTAFVDCDRGIYGFIQQEFDFSSPFVVNVLHQCYINDKYEPFHEKYHIGLRTLEATRNLEFPPLKKRKVEIKNPTISSLTQCKIVDDVCFVVIAVAEKCGNDSYRFLMQKIEDGAPFAVLYETVFTERNEVKAFFDRKVAEKLLEKVGV